MPKTINKTIPEAGVSIPTSNIEAKRTELLGIQRQLELQLNGVANQLYLIDQLLNPKPKPEPPPEPDNTI